MSPVREDKEDVLKQVSRLSVTDGGNTARDPTQGRRQGVPDSVRRGLDPLTGRSVHS